VKKARKLLLLLLLPIAAAAGVFLYQTAWLPARMRDNERAVSTALKSLTSAEADFRANDRDWNLVNDFWTADVAGLYSLKGGEKHDQELRLIERRVAEADAKPLKPLVSAPIPYHGYFFIALDGDDNMAGTPDRYYKQDTGGNPPMGKVHNTSKFAFSAYPAEYGVTGKFTFLVNENNTIFRSDIGGKPVTHLPDESPKKPAPGGMKPKLD